MDAAPACTHAALAAAAGQPLLVRTFAEWRDAARDLLAFDIAPHTVQWITQVDGGDLFSPAPAAPGAALPDIALPHANPALHLPRTLMDMLQGAACCRVEQRWALLYRVVWRWQHGEQGALSGADADGKRLRAMVRAVRRAEQDMLARIRFRERAEADGAPRFVAWFEPAHDVLAAVAQHFVRCMGRISWMIATPDASVLWDGATLHNTGPLMRSAAGLDDANASDGAGAAPWLAYYRTIFNPAPPHPPLASRPAAPHLERGLAAPAVQAASGQRRGATIPIAPEQVQVQLQSQGHGQGQAGEREDAAPATLDQCRRCTLWQHATQAVGGAGPPRARIMLVGEQPGDQEDRAGAPFVGPAGQLLERVLDEAGIARRAVYVTNAVKHFKWTPRGKRRLHKTPAQREIEACAYWLAQELAQVQPEVVVALGATALKAVLGTGEVTLKDTLGQPIRHGGRWVVAVYHPAYVLRVPDEDAKVQALAVMVNGLKLAQRLLAGDGAH